MNICLWDCIVIYLISILIIVIIINYNLINNYYIRFVFNIIGFIEGYGKMVELIIEIYYKRK